MPRLLEVPHKEDLYKIADMQRGSTGIKTRIEGDRLPVKRLGKLLTVRRLVDQTAPFQLITKRIKAGFLIAAYLCHENSSLLNYVPILPNIRDRKGRRRASEDSLTGSFRKAPREGAPCLLFY